MAIRRIRYLVAALALAWSGATVGQNLLIDNVTVIDGTGAPPLPAAAVMVTNGRIAQIGAAPAKAPRGTRRVDGTGKFLIPGLVDVHIHVPRAAANAPKGAADPGLTALHSFLYSGVTTVFDAGNNADYVMKLRADERAGKLLSPRLYAAGAVITYPKSWSAGPNAILVDAWPEDAVAIDANLARTPDLQKITYENFGAGANAWVPSFSPELFSQVVQHVLARNVQPVVHVSDEAHARDAIAAGVTRLAHPVAVAKMSPDLVPLLVANGVMTTTSLAVFDNIARVVDDPSFLDQPLMRAVMEPEQIEELKTNGRNNYLKIGWGAWFKTTRGYGQENIRKIHDAGGLVALGTDRALGPLVHRELELVVEAGIAPLDALRIATLNAARFIGVEQDMGSIAPGKWADMVLLEADPSADIRNVGRIAAVYKGGREIDRRRLALPVNRK
jgi:imidazolonepropionase-like amidohydrolase